MECKSSTTSFLFISNNPINPYCNKYILLINKKRYIIERKIFSFSFFNIISIILKNIAYNGGLYIWKKNIKDSTQFVLGDVRRCKKRGKNKPLK